MKKTIIHPILVAVPSAKLQFQIPLPRNIKRISAIGITNTGVPTLSDVPVEEAGWLWMRIPQMRDVFFADIVKVPRQSYGIHSFALIENLSFGGFTAWVDGTKEQPFTIQIDRAATMVEGFYADQLGRFFPGPYTVKIYLTIEL